MQWDASPHAGFTTGSRGSPVNPNHAEINAAARAADPDSVFHHYRRLIELRHTEPVVAHGDFTMLLPDDERVYAFTRRLGDDELLVVANFSGEATIVDAAQLPGGAARRCWSRPSAGTGRTRRRLPRALGGPRPPTSGHRPARLTAGSRTRPDPAGPGRTQPDHRRAGAAPAPARGAAPAPAGPRSSGPARTRSARRPPSTAAARSAGCRAAGRLRRGDAVTRLRVEPGQAHAAGQLRRTGGELHVREHRLPPVGRHHPVHQHGAVVGPAGPRRRSAAAGGSARTRSPRRPRRAPPP